MLPLDSCSGTLHPYNHAWLDGQQQWSQLACHNFPCHWCSQPGLPVETIWNCFIHFCDSLSIFCWFHFFSSLQEMARPNSCRILQSLSLPVIIFMPRPIDSCFANFTWPFVALKRRSEPRKNASLCSFSVGSVGLTQRSPMPNFVHLSGMETWPYWKCWDVKTFGSGSQAIFTVSNSCRGDLAAFNNMVLSSAAVSRLP